MAEITNLNDLETNKDYILKYIKNIEAEKEEEEEVAFVEGPDEYGYKFRKTNEDKTNRRTFMVMYAEKHGNMEILGGWKIFKAPKSGGRKKKRRRRRRTKKKRRKRNSKKRTRRRRRRRRR